ncbi:MAG: bifunctional riboflavin kinase/FAD synthetase [candidate division Zixibacteria bacterium]|nr:bifunctional riboflavin kinase/FAD synthetase [candidate division Zixibacteria bacterium]
MKIFYGLNEFSPLEKPIVTPGTFDGIHLGHQAILKELVREKKLRNKDNLLVTYEPHPQYVVSPQNAPLVLSTLEEKIAILENLPEGKFISGVLVIKFTGEFSRLSPDWFIPNILINKINAGMLIIGENHAFGCNRIGGIELLSRESSKYGFDLKVIPSILFDNQRISSSRIRKEMQTGDFEKACLMLGHSYLVSGKPVKGKGIGKEIGYPTINLEVPKRKLLPKSGVYGVETKIKDNKYYGMMYIGRKLTLDDEALSLELHLFDYYEKELPDNLMIYLKKWIRGEKKFDNLKELKTQLNQDEKTIRHLLNR